MEVNIEQIRALAELAQDKGLAELTVTDGDKTVTIKTTTVSPMAQTVYAQPLPAPQAAPVQASAPPAEAAPVPAVSSAYTITAPMVGTFYRSPSPESPPFVALGQTISTGQTLCIIEAMKLMNELEAEVSGKIVEILVENGQPVEFGQPLFRVEQG